MARRLSIVIPALNEEAAIGSTLARCVAARHHIQLHGGLESVEILVVSDGSSDGTERIACSVPEVTVLAFERNRGYGAAIQCGFAFATGDLLGFMDADGTCDPRFFADLCAALEKEKADVALGSRMGEGSEMPLVRTVGNLAFAWILGVLARRSVRDTASGMRVLRRSALEDLYPLPDGLHFTPAMSARALLEGKLSLIEVPMPYAERVGRSKLSVLRDGGRFLRSIIEAATAYRPARPLLLATGALALGAAVVGVGPFWLWLRERQVEEWMIYRILFASFLAGASGLVLCAAVVADRIASLAHGRPLPSRGVTAMVNHLFAPRGRRAAFALLVLATLVVTWPGIVQYATSGHVQMHWSRAVLGSLFALLAMAVATTAFTLLMLDLIAAKRAPRDPIEPPDRVRPARRDGP